MGFTEGFTDIRRWNWIERLPSAVRPYIYLARLDRPIGWWLLLLPGWISIALVSPALGGQTLWLFLLFFIGAVIMRGAGCVINDLWDRDLDRQVERTAARPIASGQIEAEDAVIFLVLLLLMGLAILVMLPPLAIFLGLLSLPLIAAYPFMKRITWWPQAFLGITFNFGALMGAAAVGGVLPFAAAILYAACFFWTLGYDTVYAHQDKEDDLQVGIRSTALLFGEDSPKMVMICYAAAGSLLLLSALIAGVHWIAYPLLLGLYGWVYARLIAWDPTDRDSALAFFKENKLFGLMVTIIFLLAKFF